ADEGTPSRNRGRRPACGRSVSRGSRRSRGPRGGWRPQHAHRPTGGGNGPAGARLRRGGTERPERRGRLHRPRREGDPRPRSDRRNAQRHPRDTDVLGLPCHRTRAAFGRYRRRGAHRPGGGRTRPRPQGPGTRHAPHVDCAYGPRGRRGPSDLGGTFMKFGITANPRIPSAMECATQVLAKLESKQEVLLESDLARALGRKGMPLAHMKADVMLAIGGDGTILRALQLSDSKVLGINSGSLGFLAEVNADDMDRYLDQTIRG